MVMAAAMAAVQLRAEEPATVKVDRAAQLQFFEARIRPVLIKHCYECHSAESETVKGGLRLDSALGWSRGGDSGPAIVPGKPEESSLLAALKFDGVEMPPSGRLAGQIVSDFENWIAGGAVDPRREEPALAPSPAPHNQIAAKDLWSFQSVASVAIPEVKATEWPRTAIDHFVLARLEQSGLKPIEDADAGTLLRRLSFDLVGLPPSTATIEQLQSSTTGFDLDSTADDLLQSKQFGEHWARHWLDVARYADSNGGDFNATFHDAWRYRNYVIDVFNSDQPFDQFIVEQIAGDLLPAANDQQRSKQVIATGFLMLGAKMLSERDKRKLQMDVVDEQISVVGTAFMGLTLGCARCHDHKFDPVSAEDYYALAGIFKSTHALEGEIQKYVSDWIRPPLPISLEHRRALDEYKAESDQLAKRIAAVEKQIKTLDKKQSGSQLLEQGVVIDDSQAELVGNWKRSTNSKPYVGKDYIHDEREEKGEKSVTFRTRLPREGQYEVRLSYTAAGGRADNVPVSITHHSGISQLTVDQEKPPTIEKLFLPLGKYRFNTAEDAVVTISTAGTVGFVIVDAVQFVESAGSDAAKQTAAAAKSKTSEAQSDDAVISPELAEAKQQLAELQAQQAKLKKNAPPPAPLALAVEEAKEIGDCHICIRGEPDQVGAVVPRGFIKALQSDAQHSFSQASSGRLELAQWLADPRHPLTARVVVNRIWKNLMGEGLVPSVDNFGQLGERPTHPELLDYLAREFIEHNWSTKWLVREIVRSHAYQLASRSDETCEAIDPENVLLWRANRKRLSAEAIRDTFLSATGELSLDSAESPVGDLGTLVTQNNPNDAGYSQSGNSRRTIYQPIIRNELPALMRVFDFADPDVGTGGRSATTVPAQALWMLNGPMVQTQAAILARDVTAQAAEVEERIVNIYVRALGRHPTYAELKLAREFIERIEDKKHEAIEPWSDLAHAVFATSAFRLID